MIWQETRQDECQGPWMSVLSVKPRTSLNFEGVREPLQDSSRRLSIRFASYKVFSTFFILYQYGGCPGGQNGESKAGRESCRESVRAWTKQLIVLGEEKLERQTIQRRWCRLWDWGVSGQENSKITPRLLPFLPLKYWTWMYRMSGTLLIKALPIYIF